MAESRRANFVVCPICESPMAPASGRMQIGNCQLPTRMFGVDSRTFLLSIERCTRSFPPTSASTSLRSRDTFVETGSCESPLPICCASTGRFPASVAVHPAGRSETSFGSGRQEETDAETIAINSKPGTHRNDRVKFVDPLARRCAPRTRFCRMISLARVDGWSASFQTRYMQHPSQSTRSETCSRLRSATGAP